MWCGVLASARVWCNLLSMKRHSLLRLVVIGAVALPLHSCVRGQAEPVPSEWSLVWRDEFNGAAGGQPDSSSWSYTTGDGCADGICGWGNSEKETYTSSLENIVVDGQGHLAIVARVAPVGLTCYYGPCRYSSGKIRTIGKVLAEPGRVEARIKLPAGQGLWPAFWLLGSGYPRTPWPRSGELDVMENHGSRPNEVSSAIHGPGYSGATPFVGSYPLARGSFADDFHRYAVEWDTAQVRFFVDDSAHYTVTRSDVGRYGAWVFDQPFFVILNLAVGGKFDGDPASDTILPATMLVDYVRIYRRAR